MEIKGTVPKQDNYHLAPEWNQHAESYMLWPMRPDNWREGGKPAQKVYAEIAKHISEVEPVTMLVNRSQYQHAHSVFENTNVRVVEMSYNDAFFRDLGPTFLKNGTNVRAIDWEFNAWGGLFDGLYFPWDQDNLVSKKVCELNRIDYYHNDFVLEGCGFVTDGQGTLILTEESVMSEGRNGVVQKEAVEQLLKDYLNVKQIIWIEQGYYMDETNGDIDNMVRFVKPGEVVLTWTDDKNDPQYQISRAALQTLEAATDANGNRLKIHKIQIPSPMYASDGESEGVDPVNGLLPRYPGDRLVASYVNFYIVNGAVILPTFNDEQDAVAIKTFSELFPDHKIIPIYCRELLLGGGNIHSIVASIPK